MKVPKIDYTGLHVRQVEFARRKQEWIVKIQRQDQNLVRLKQTNFDLIGKLKQMNLQIDELFQQAQIKSQIDAMREKDSSTVEEYDCEHEAMIERLQELIKRKFLHSIRAVLVLIKALVYTRKGASDCAGAGPDGVANRAEGPRDLQLLRQVENRQN